MKRKNLFVYLLITALEITALTGIILSNFINKPDLQNEIKIASKLHLTDLCLATESRHTRNIAFPLELTAPFQDVPGFFDHFPSSTFIHPSTDLIRNEWSNEQP